MDGMPGMGGGRGGPKKSNNTRYYELLQVHKDASADELKKAHRKLALKLHPDKGGDPDKFKEINEAYDTLKDPEKRRIYDEYGEDAIKEGMGSGGGGGGMADIFEMFGGGGGGSRGPKKSEDVVHKLSASLEEMYTGATKKLSLSRSVPCDPCKGSGARSGRKYECTTCRGTGVQVMMRPIGPGMVQQIQQRCSSCNGTKFSVPPSDKCPSCNGKALVSEKKTFEVHIEQGMKNGAKIVLRGEAGCSEPGLPPGNVVLVVQQKEHELFKRAGADLVIKKDINLTEALCGTIFTIKHLDGRHLRVTMPPGEVIKPDTFKRVVDEGMPVNGRPHLKGNLYIQFSVNFPDRLDKTIVASLLRVLPPVPVESDMDEDDIHDVMNLPTVHDIEDELKGRANMTRGGGGGEAYDDEDDEGHGGAQRVQCAQQ